MTVGNGGATAECGLNTSARCRLWWRYAVRATVQGVRRSWRIATVERLLELVEQNFVASLEVRGTVWMSGARVSDNCSARASLLGSVHTPFAACALPIP